MKRASLFSKVAHGHALGDALFVKQLLQLAGLIHFHHDIRTADKFAFDIELRHRWPVGVILMPWRISSEARTFTSLNGTPMCWRICTVRPEKPHCGISAVPFMKS